MKTQLTALCLLLFGHGAPSLAAASDDNDASPPAQEQQLPKRMRSAMPEVVRLTVGHTNADLLGSDQRALQAGGRLSAGADRRMSAMRFSIGIS